MNPPDNSGPFFEIAARIDHLSDGVGCFDPIQVLARMRIAFPNLVESTRDHLWNTVEGLRKLGAGGALRTAVRDMQERGPAIMFEIPLHDGRSISGTAERYSVRIYSDGSDFPDDFRRSFIGFLQTLKLQPIEIHHGMLT